MKYIDIYNAVHKTAATAPVAQTLEQNLNSPTPKYPNAPGTYTFQNGDTLWGIRKNFAQINGLKPTDWTGIINLFKKYNPGIKDVNNIKAGTTVHMGGE